MVCLTRDDSYDGDYEKLLMSVAAVNGVFGDFALIILYVDTDIHSDCWE